MAEIWPAFWKQAISMCLDRFWRTPLAYISAVLTALTVLWAAAIPSFAHEDVPTAAEPLEMYVSYEVELQGSKLGLFSRLLDLQYFEKQLLKNTPYLLNKNNLANYPEGDGALEDMRQRFPGVYAVLTEDLNFANKLISPRSLVVKPQPVLGSDGKALKPGVVIVPAKPLQMPGLILPNRPDPQIVREELGTTHQLGSVVVGNGVQWQELLHRWQQLDLGQQRTIVRLAHMPQKQIADLISRLKVDRKLEDDAAKYLRLKKDAPDWTKLILISMDGEPQNGRGVLEFYLAQPMTDVAAFLSHIEEVKASLSLKGLMEAPTEMKRSDTSLHLHVSFPQEDSLTELILAFKKVVALRLVAQNSAYERIFELPFQLEDPKRGSDPMPAYDLGLGNHLSFINLRDSLDLYRQRYDVNDRDYISFGRLNHVEIKEPYATPKVMIEELRRLVTRTRKAAIRSLEKEISQILIQHPEIVNKIMRLNPMVILDFLPYLPFQQKVELRAQALEGGRYHMQKAFEMSGWEHYREPRLRHRAESMMDRLINLDTKRVELVGNIRYLLETLPEAYHLSMFGKLVRFTEIYPELIYELKAKVPHIALHAARALNVSDQSAAILTFYAPLWAKDTKEVKRIRDLAGSIYANWSPVERYAFFAENGIFLPLLSEFSDLDYIAGLPNRRSLHALVLLAKYNPEFGEIFAELIPKMSHELVYRIDTETLYFSEGGQKPPPSDDSCEDTLE